MPAKTVAFEQIKKLMGWCPVYKKTAQQTKQFHDFANMVPISGKTGNFLEFQISNVVFPANTTISLAYFMISFNLLLRLKFPEETFLFLVDLLLFNFSYYLLVLKTFEAAVLVDRSGVRLQAFRLKKFNIPYEEIESIKSYRLEKRSKKMSLLLIIGGIALCGFVVYMAVVKGEWKILLLLISLLPLILFAMEKQKTQFGNLNTQLYIKTKHKK
ncbi:hypothetical protein MSBRW_3559 [Methanosarcina barkeri str. Wiesmoor]|uniref:Uncharacterized protein n=2 Tax=Methanosarcina barkeri TaxID=2208 RepID=A0A0E3QR29_METBA|nr:hypothetical protein [Methanosarcina barkeri]AKB52812.1 hypothetical protein MSBRW_3559 [Methanosarcina barkeri str. Wiesmoor]